MNKFKVLSVVLAVLMMAGCTSTDVTETDDAASSEQERRATEQAEADERIAAEAVRAQQMLEDAVANAGNVVYFDFDKSTLTAATRRTLDAHAALLKSNNAKVRLEGHTDERGTREYNMALGERRAKAVGDYMALNGVAGYRTEAVSYGEERPVAIGMGEANWSQNRRVELK